MGGVHEASDSGREQKEHGHDLGFYRFVVNSIPTGVVTVNGDFKITGFNPCAERMTGYKEAEAIGHFCGDILQGGMCRLDCPLKTAVKGKRILSLVETTIRNKWGKEIPVRLNTAGLFDDNGHLIGGVESFQDISRLKALEREKNNLISMFAHDMKSSLTIIGGYAARLLKKLKEIEEAKQERYIEIIKDESGKLESLIEVFLEFSRLQTGKLKLNVSATSLDKELMEVLDSYQLRATEAGVKLKLETEETLPVIQADSHQLRRVLGNLVDNALKFSRRNSTVTVAAEETPTEVVVKVKDEGVGIPSHDLPYIFDPFHRGSGAEEKRGFGLGLAGVKAITEAHGGRVDVDSKEGKGSVFTVALPKVGRSENDNKNEVWF